MGLITPYGFRGKPTLSLVDHVVAPSIFFDNLRLGKVDRTGSENRQRAFTGMMRLARALQESPRYHSRLDTAEVSVELFGYAQELQVGEQFSPERCAHIRDRILEIGELLA